MLKKKINFMHSIYATYQRHCCKISSMCNLKYYNSCTKSFTTICRTPNTHRNITYKRISCKELHSENKDPVQENQYEPNYNSFTNRTHTCGELRSFHKGQTVELCGWVQYQRLSKFILIRDSYGLTQCIVKDDSNIPDIPLETVVKIRGAVSLRPKNMINSEMPTGEIEVLIEDWQIINTVDNLPFNIRNYQKPKEHLRLQHRYIDLRFPEMQNNLRMRSQMLHGMRRFLIEKHGFVEVETPTLFCRTPGGAREFVVPTHHPGLFYSLVQSPQQFKQMLMAGGVDRYFQIARCYRDETTRPDRQPEFTQLDIELSFTNLDGVLSLIEHLLYETYIKDLPRPPFRKMTYKYALENYGSDKPNLSYNLQFKNITHLLGENSQKTSAFVMPYTCELGKITAKYKEQIRTLAKQYEVKVVLNDNIQKEFGDILIDSIKLSSEHAIISIGESENACLCLGEIREILAMLLKSKNLLDIDNSIQPLWVIDFPLFIKGSDGLETCHHPFTAPHPDDMHLLDTLPLAARSLAYDLVMNGHEVGGGSIRVHDVELQNKLLSILNIDSSSLSHFLNALKSGCPPHGGIALGIDRLMSLACKAESIRDVIAFPKSHNGKDPLSGAPNVISDEDKKFYNLSIV